MLDRMHLSGIHDRFLVWICHADVKGCDDCTFHMIFPGDIKSRNQFIMIDRKTCDFFHDSTSGI